MFDQKFSNRYSVIGTTIALVTSILALLVSVYEANIMQSQQKALVWPHVRLESRYSSQGYTLMAKNNGIGPALIESMQVTYLGQMVTNYEELLDLIKPDRTFGYNLVEVETFNGTVLSAGEERRLLHIPFAEGTHAVIDSLYHVDIEFAYASVLGEYWHHLTREGETKEERFKAKVEFVQK